jgi:hypothetical protein
LNLYGYYWSVRESEVATDVMFKDAAALAKVYPAMVNHAIKCFHCHDVLRFLGQRTNARFSGQATSSLLERAEGVRVKHWIQENSIKMYDKQGSVLRVETTINNVRRFKVRRMTERQGIRRMRWIPMRLGLADLERRVEVSRAANERYLEALAVVEVSTPVAKVLDTVSRRVIENNRPYRALRPISPEEAKIFRAALSGEFLIRGFTNREFRQTMGQIEPTDHQELRRQSGRATRLLRLLCAHKLIYKVSRTRYYRVTKHGQQVMSAALTLRTADVAKLAA